MSPWVSTWFLQAQSDERLVAAARLGHHRAFDILVARYRRALLGHARRLLGDARAEDAVQQGLLQAWTALQRGGDIQHAPAWLHRVVHNAALDLLRRRDHDHEPLGEVAHAQPGTESEVESRFAVRDALRALAALPDAQREVLQRTAIEGDTQPQVASALGLSENAVRGLVYRARATLRAATSALTPPSLVEWAARAERHGARFSARLFGGGAGGASVGVGLLKGGAAAVTVGALAIGAAVVHRDRTFAQRTPGPAVSARQYSASLPPFAAASAWSASPDAGLLAAPAPSARSDGTARRGRARLANPASLSRTLDVRDDLGSGAIAPGDLIGLDGGGARSGGESSGGDRGSVGESSGSASTEASGGGGSLSGSERSSDGGSSGSGTPTSSNAGEGTSATEGGGGSPGGPATSDAPAPEAGGSGGSDGGASTATTSGSH